nr:glucose-repressible alcohol dehydrogenase transcriptional effector [Quercus suber]
MADGYNRFTGGQYYYPNNHSAAHARGINHRNGSPVSNNRGLIFSQNTDTPSPNRSPGTNSPAHNPYSSMYNHGTHRTNHGLLNGNAGHQTYQAQMGLHKGFQSQAHGHQGHHVGNQSGHDNGLGGHNSFAGHQHSISTSTLSNNTPHFTPAHLQNGTSDGAGVANKPTNDNWAEQLREYNRLKMAEHKPHFYARTTPHVSRTPGPSANNAASRDAEEHGERRRAAPVEEPEESGEWDAMDLGGHGLKCMAPTIFRFYPDLRKIYLNHNKLQWLPTQIGQMRSLTVLDLSFNDLRHLPPEIGMLTNLRKLLLFDNHLVDLPTEMGSLYQLDMLGIEGNPLRHDYKERIMEHGTRDMIEYLREQAEPPPPPEDRPWTVLVPDTDSEPDKFSVLSWNTLCDRAATQVQYGYTPSEALSWQYRRHLILEELRMRDADIMTLQEIDVENYNEYFRPNLATVDYKGIFSPKSRAQTMSEKEQKNVDGCAIFYKNSKFILLEKKIIVFSREAISRPDMKGEHDMYNRVMPRDHIAVVLFLENRMTGSRMIVANTHLTWEAWFADVKVIQVAIMMEQLEKLAKEWAKFPPAKIEDKKLFKYANEDSAEGVEAVVAEPAPSIKYEDPQQIPLVVCGDFNSMKGSGVCDLITQGSLSNSHPDLGAQNYGDFTRNGMGHPFSLKSAYAQAELPFTNYTPGFIQVIDYIWYSTNALQVTGLLGEVDRNYMKRVAGFPNHHFPSDHLALWAEFSVKSRKERKQVEADFGPSSRRESTRH